MAETSGFFDAEELLSGDYDREYVSEQFAEYFALFIGNGVFASPTNQLKVVAGEGMNIVVKEGWAFINGRWYHNDSDLIIPVPPNTTATAITSGVFVQQTKSDRDIHSTLATGRTTPDREEPYYELKLAELRVPVGVTSITDAMITDTRTNENVCGFVKGLLDGVITTEDLFAQYTAIFMQWFDHMKGQLSEDAAGHLQQEVDDINSTLGDSDISDIGDGTVTGILAEIFNLVYPVGSIYMSTNSANPSTKFGGTWAAWGSGRVPVGVDANDTAFNTVEKTGGAKSHSYTPAGTNSGGAVQNHWLTVAEIPSHDHGGITGWMTQSNKHSHSVGMKGSYVNTGSSQQDNFARGSGIDAYLGGTNEVDLNHQHGIPAQGGGGAHNHGFTQPTFTGTASTQSHLQPYITCYMWKRTA